MRGGYGRSSGTDFPEFVQAEDVGAERVYLEARKGGLENYAPPIVSHECEGGGLYEVGF